MQNVKVVYRRFLHAHLMHKMKEDMNADPYRHISIASVLTWVNKAWKEMRPRTISACFSHCGKQLPNSGTVPNNVEEQVNAGEQALQELEANDKGVFQSLVDNENLMKQPVKRLEQMEKETNEEAGEEEDQTRLSPTSAYIAKAL